MTPELDQLPAEERQHVYLQVGALLIVPAALVILLASVATAAFVWDDSRKRSAANRELIERVVEAERAQKRSERRADVRDRAAREATLDAARRSCRDLEAVKEQIRATVTVDELEFRRQLAEVLHIDPDSRQAIALLKRAKTQEAETLARFKPRSCRAFSGP